MKKIKNQQHGFITLFFILGVSFTFLTWISLSSERVFEYIHIKNTFTIQRSTLHNHILCADAFINILINSRFNLNFTNNNFNFERNLYYVDDSLCSVKSISIIYQDNTIKTIFFIIGEFRFQYQFKNGFVNSMKSFNLF